jgi:hypothetical protein
MMFIPKKAGLVLLTTLAASQLYAGTLVSYATGDLLLGFRKSGGANNLVVDVGPITTFTNASPNTRINITQFTTNQLYKVGLNSLIFSGFTYYSTGNESGDNQLFMSRGRANINNQTAAWSQIPGITTTANLFCGNDIGGVVQGAASARTYDAVNSDSAVVEPDDSSFYNAGTQNAVYNNGQSYAWAMNGQGTANFNGDWGGNGTPEKTTPSNFTTGSSVVRADLYLVPPQGYESVKFLGYFELNTNGLMSYVAYPSAAPAVPVIRSIARTNNITYVSFSTGGSGSYTLRGTNNVSGFQMARTNWPSISSVSGNGGVNMLQDTTSVSSKFYVITAQ